MSERVIKRYANRKMYDVENSTYVSLADIAAMIRHGEIVRVTDKDGKEDYTTRILQQIILDQSKETDQTTVTQLHDWIRMGGSILDRQLSGLSTGMEKWIQEQTTRLFKGFSREEFEKIKEKVHLLEKKIQQLESHDK